MKLYLVRHAEAKQKEIDPEKSLSERGISEITKVGSFISKNTFIQPNIIYHSGKTRTRQTAEILGEYLNPQNGVNKAEGLKSLDSPKIWRDKLLEKDEDIMLVSHLPYLTRLTGLLLCKDENKKIINFKNAEIVYLGKDKFSDWSVKWIIIPEILR